MKKRKLVVLMMMLVLVFSFAACGEKESGSRNSSGRDGRTSDSDAVTNIGTDDSTGVATNGGNANAMAVYTGSIYEYDESEYPTDITVNLLDDTKCEVIELYKSSDLRNSTYYYLCDYEMDGDDIVAKCPYEDGTSTMFTITVSADGTVTDFYEGYDEENADVSAIVGTYTCVEPEGDTWTLTVEKSGSAVMESDYVTYSGTIFIYDDNWDFTGDNGEDYDSDEYYSVDLYIFFDGDTFTYKSYKQSVYEEYAGTYYLTGALGDFNVEVDECGNAYCSVKVDGEERDFFGNLDYYEADYGDAIISLYLYSDNDEYTLNLELNEWSEGEYNYYGSVTKTLGAG